MALKQAGRRAAGAWLLLLLAALLQPAMAGIRLIDAEGRALELATPAQRIVTLAPHLTDILLVLGARGQVVAVSDDHQQRGAHATSLSGFPVVSDAASINYERVLALKPDVALAWGGGTPQAWIAQLRRMGVAVFVVEANDLEGVARQIEQLGQLSGHEAAGRQQAAQVRTQVRRLAADYGKGPRLRYFYQVWRQPLYSLHGGHLLSQALALCGADNILPPGPVAAPLVSPEFVLQRNPDMLFFNRADTAGSIAYWRRFARLEAVRRQQWLGLDDLRLTRPTADMLAAVEPVCAQIASWRKRKAPNPR
ncbi:MAG: btuF [Moraxellaceae bacterium]|jgi:ABC-type Fe3+-hydroxamate transport system substrate-binding protein|nr:btuF [Moraxellaceae bacterium]